MERPINSDKEARAIDALIAAAFRMGASDPVTPEEAERFVEESSNLSVEDRNLIKSCGDDFVDNLLCNLSSSEASYTTGERNIDPEIENALAAMHRKKKNKEMSEETLRKLDKKRRELLGENNIENDV